MPELLSTLRAFNRKERFLLLQWALDRPGFQLGQAFRERLGALCGIDLSGEVFVAMDYHLDWLYAALVWSTDTTAPEIVNDKAGTPEGAITGSQEDVDLLIAAPGPKGTTTVVVCEAKGYTSLAPAQLNHKASRLGAIFGEDGDRFPDVTPHFVLLGPRKLLIQTDGWAPWMIREEEQPLFLPLPAPEGRYAVERDVGGNWSSWKIRSARWPD